MIQRRERKNAQASVLKHLETLPWRARMGVGGAYEDQFDSRGQQCVGAGGRAAHMAAGLQGDDRGPREVQAARRPAHRDRGSLGMGAPRAFVRGLREDLTVAAQQYAAHRRVWRRRPGLGPGQVQGPLRRGGQAING